MEPNSDNRPANSPAPEQIQEIFHLLSGYRVSQAMYVVVELGIPDLLADGPQDSDTLAQATSTHTDALYRVLRFLVGVGIFDEIAPRQFGLTTLGASLRTNVPGSLRPTVLMHLAPYKWEPWGHLLHSVQTGGTAFHHVHGMKPFDYLDQHPEDASIFQQAMTNNTAWSGTTITQAYDFTGIECLVDIGGGQGLLLATILQAYPTMRGVLFDRPNVVKGALAAMETAGVALRCEIVGGDFFATVPAGGDAYVLRLIIHDWDDAHAVAILKSCRSAMRQAGRVLIVERMIVPDYRQALPVLHLDLEMLVNVGGKQRTTEEYRALFAAADLRLSAVIPLGDTAQFSVFEGVPA